MGRSATGVVSPVLFVGKTNSRILSPNEDFAEVLNMYPTEEGSYRSIVGVYPYLRAQTTSWPTVEPDGNYDAPLIGVNFAGFYGEMKGVGHAVIRGREILLIHTGDQIWELDHPGRTWRVIVGPASSNPKVVWKPRVPVLNELEVYPTQFVPTPSGVVIVPPQGRLFFYDGHIAAPLGFVVPPSAPQPLGPENEYIDVDLGITKVEIPSPNQGGYAHHGLWGIKGQMDTALGKGRIGTVESLPDVNLDPDPAATGSSSSTAGRLLDGSVRYRQAWVDPWGNISALSPPSEEVAWSRMPSKMRNWSASTTGTVLWGDGDRARIQLAVDAVSNGPPHAIGRNLYRTRDLKNSGDPRFYFLPGDSQPSQDAFATIPDHTTEFFPDNVPDAWLVQEAPDLVPTPIARVAALAFGRLWVGQILGRPGSIMPSLPGLFGTFPAKGEIVPDPTGSTITGLHTIPEGLLAYTPSSTFLIVPNDSGEGFRVMTLSSSVGTVAPSSIASTRFGMVIWLGRDGFYGYDGQKVVYLFGPHREQSLRFNRATWGLSNAVFDPASGQYQCWVPVDSNRRPNVRYKFDGNAWHWDPYDGTIEMVHTCVTQDHRALVIGVGQGRHDRQTSQSGVWVLDHGFKVQPASVKTGWIRALNSDTKASIRRVHLWLRETGSFSIEVRVRRNFRAEIVSTHQVRAYPDIAETQSFAGFYRRPTDIEKNPDRWGAVEAAPDHVMRRRRPFWTDRSIDIPTCETFQLEIKSNDPFELIGLSFEEFPRDESGATSRRGSP